MICEEKMSLSSVPTGPSPPKGRHLAAPASCNALLQVSSRGQPQCPPRIVGLPARAVGNLARSPDQEPGPEVGGRPGPSRGCPPSCLPPSRRREEPGAYREPARL